MTDTYDSALDTATHIRVVQTIIFKITEEIKKRAFETDLSLVSDMNFILFKANNESLENYNLIELLELMAHWKVASIPYCTFCTDSIEQQKKIFGYNDEIHGIMLSTAKWLDYHCKHYSYEKDIPRKIMLTYCSKLTENGISHDRSKFFSPEKDIFDEYTPKLKEVEFDSEDYKKYLKEMNVALDHHYSHNSHHPEYHNGISKMSLINLLDMMCDWKASTFRQKNGDLKKSIEFLQKRYEYSDTLRKILENTVEFFDDLDYLKHLEYPEKDKEVSPEKDKEKSESQEENKDNTEPEKE